MATVLLTGVGGVGGTATAKALLRHSSHDLVGIDMDALGSGLYLLEDSEVVPAADSDAWIPAVVDVIERHGVDVVVPLVDEELARLPELKEHAPETVAFVAPRQEVLEDTLDKYRMATTLDKYGISVPATQLLVNVSDPESIPYPVIIKPRRGHGSNGVKRVDSLTEFEEYLARTDLRAEELLVQEFVDGTEYTTSVVVTTDDQLHTVVPKEVLEKNGNTVRGVTRTAPSVAEVCRSIHEAIEPCGPINVQQIISEATGDVYTIEINPRFSSTACLTVEAGVNELDYLIRRAVGEPAKLSEEFRSGVHLLRYTDQVFVRENELLE